MKDMDQGIRYHDCAMQALERDDFYSAQEYFQKALKRTPSYQTYNNLGYFYLSEGRTDENGCVKSADAVGMRYLKKALAIKSTAITSRSLGYFLYQKRAYQEACEFFSLSYSIKQDDSVLYDLAAAQYMARNEAVLSTLAPLRREGSTEAMELYLFAVLRFAPEELSAVLEREKNWERLLDPPEIMELRYFTGKYEAIRAEVSMLLSEWSLWKEQWAMLIDAFLSCDAEEELACLMREHFETYDETPARKKEMRDLRLMLRNERMRKRCIEAYEYVPVIFPFCGYFGCSKHDQPWDGIE